MARAREILAFWPPDTEMPRSPTSVSSYAAHCLKSSTINALSTAIAYKLWSMFVGRL